MRGDGGLPALELEIAYRRAAARLRAVGEWAVAQRFERRAGELARGGVHAGPCLRAAIRHAIDAGGARIAARLDRAREPLWLAIAEDQSRMAARRLRCD